MEGATAMIDFRYVAWPWALPLVVILPVVTAWMVARARRSRARRLSHLGTPLMIARLAPTASVVTRWHSIRLALAALFLGIAFAGPRWGIERTVVKQEGIDVVLALDASSSMLAADETPDRLTKMKEVVDQLRALSPNDRFALIAFAGRSYVLSPVTIDGAALNLFIENLDPTVVGQSGSSISSALRQANNLLGLSKSEAERAIVLMSDGEGFEEPDEVIAEARRAAAAGTTVITVGFGTPEGTTIPVRKAGATTPKVDQAGNVVITRFVPELLQVAAQEGKGVFVPPGEVDRAATIRSTLARLRTEQRSLTRGTNLAQRFQWFILPALLLLLLDSFLLTRRGRRRELSAVATAASAFLVMFSNGCSTGQVRDKEAARLYNRGTAMLARPDSIAESVPVFRRAEVTKDVEVRYRAGFNGGYVHLRQGLDASGDSATIPLDSALAVYKRVLTLRPDDADAKWNYELALRKKESGGGGGGGGGEKNPEPEPDPQSAENEAPRPRPIPGMNESRAEQLLNAVEQQEQDVQGRKQRRSVPQPPPNGRDW
ncbi:MAG TPA: VWA domain-containing protein [Gemmatimonadaceae bacterium]|nr:VWA domain-containing protein [Gemmatimonadaceae bacterium]